MSQTEIDSASPGAPANPWMGLAYYTEKDKDLFFGRNHETQELLRLIERDTLTVLFGRSGLGKTSLLRAGLVPRLWDSAWFPVLLRIDYSEEAPAPALQVRSAVIEAARGAGVELENVPADEDTTLWEFFRTAEFWGVRNDPLAPLLIFDQFEELFTLGRNSLKSQPFLEELADLAEDRVPKCLKERAQEHEERLSLKEARHPAKILLSLREDYVPRLDLLRPLLPAIMRNRFALQPLDCDRAVEVVLGAGKDFVQEAVAWEIVNFVAGGARPQQQPALPGAGTEIEPAYLSVMCHELFRKMVETGLGQITSGLVAHEQGGILENLYERSFEGLSPSTRVFVEDRLLTAKGYRITVPLEEAVGEGIAEEEIYQLVDRRLLRLEERLGARHIELSHDLLSRIVQDSRNRRRQRETEELNLRQQAELRRKLARTRLHAALGIGAAALLLLGIFLYYWGWHRPYTAYYKSFSKRYGVIYPLDPLSAEAVRHRAFSLRITRKSRFRHWFEDGQIQTVEAVDSSGHLTQNHRVGTYFSDSDEQGKPRECQWEFIYDDRGRVMYEFSRDRFGRIVYGLVRFPSDLRDKSRSRTSTKAVFVGADGYPQPQRKSRAEYIDISYDPNGFERERRFSDRAGRPAAGPDDAFGRALRYDPNGRVVLITSLDADGRPMIDKVGNASQVIVYDKHGNWVENRLLDTLGKPTLSKSGYAISRAKYDTWGNPVEVRFFDVHGLPVAPTDTGAHMASFEYDKWGNMIREAFFGTGGSPVEGHWSDYSFTFHEVRHTFNADNKVTSESYFDSFGRPISGSDGWHTVMVDYDRNGFMAQDRYFDTSGKPVNTVEGFQRITFQNNSSGSPIVKRYYGADAMPVSSAEGFHLAKSRYDKNGRILEQSYFDPRGNPGAERTTGAHRIAMAYDRFGNITERQYFGWSGPINSKLGYQKEVNTYNSFGMLTSTAYFDADGKPALSQGVHKTLYTYDSMGLLQEIDRFGTDGSPAEDENGIHRELFRYDSKRQLVERIYFSKDDRPAAGADGVHLELNVYDPYGRLVRTTQIGKHGEGVLDRALGIATREEELDADGVWIMQAFLDARNRLTMGPYGFAKGKIIRSGNDRSEKFNYDAAGKVILNKLTGWAIYVEDDSKKGVTVRSYLGPGRESIAGPEGWSECRTERDGNGRTIRESFFDERHRPTYGPQGYHRMERVAGKEEAAFFDTEGKRVDSKNMVDLLVINQVASVHTPASKAGLEAGDILWQLGEWSFPELLEKLRSQVAPQDVLKNSWFDFEAARNAARERQTPTRIVVIRKGERKEFMLPVLPRNNGAIGINITSRSLPRKAYEALATKVRPVKR